MYIYRFNDIKISKWDIKLYKNNILNVTKTKNEPENRCYIYNM